MKKKLFATALMAATMAFAQDGPPMPVPAKAEHTGRKVAMREERVAAGRVSRLSSEGGIVRFFDIRLKKSDISGQVAEMQKFCSVAMDSVGLPRPEGVSSLNYGLEALKAADVAVAIVIANDGKAPTLVVCPEDCVVVINADRLSEDLPAEKPMEMLEVRLGKELWRALAFALGGYSSDFPCVMRPVSKPAEIDTIGLQMCPPVANKIMAAAKQYGVARMQTVPYGVAVKQGWAPPPTNDAQRAIWKRLSSAATNTPAATPPAK